jgi:acetylglutamate kinase
MKTIDADVAASRGTSAQLLTIVKIGGSVLQRTPAGEAVLDRVAAAWRAGDDLLVVHGGGAELSRWLERLGIASRFVDGQRVTTEEILQVALMVLGGLINRRVVEGLVRRGCPAVGLTGADGAGTLALPVGDGLGAVGRIISINAAFYVGLLAERRLPVVASLAWSPDHGWLNVNADLMAAAFASGLRARRLFLMTDVEGVLDEAGSTIPVLTVEGLREVIESGQARDGMIPKLRACHQALEARVEEILIAPYYPGTPGAGGGTRIVAERVAQARGGER